MKRTVLETALVIAAIVLGLETLNYRQAVLEANVDRKRAWRTVVQLRETCGTIGHEHEGAPAPR